MSRSPTQMDTDIAEFLALGGRVVLEPMREQSGTDGPDQRPPTHPSRSRATRHLRLPAHPSASARPSVTKAPTAKPTRERTFGSTRRDPETTHGGPTRNSRAIPMGQLSSNTEHPGRDARNETTPWHIWEHAVFEIAGVSVEDGRKYATRERIQRAYQAGEPAWMAADMVRKFVDGARRAAREVDGIDDLRRAMIAGALPRGSR